MWLLNQNNRKSLLIILAIIFFSLPSVFSLLQKGFFQSDDGEWMIIRFSAFYQALRDGQFPVRFLERLNYGYGYPVANFLYPGFMYLAVPIHIFGFDFVDTIKIVLGLSMVSSALFVYFWLSRLFNAGVSLLAAFFYLYTPYHLYDLYKRASVGEVLSLTVLPFVLWQIERKSFFWPIIGVGLLITSHNTLAILFLTIIVFYMLVKTFSTKDKENIKQYIGIVVLGLGTSCFFWLPALLELRHTIFFETSISSFNQYFANINLVGISNVFVYLSVLIICIYKKIQISRNIFTLLFFAIGMISIFFSQPTSAFLWNVLPVSFIQFPFRFLSVTMLCSSFLIAWTLSLLSKRPQIIFGFLIFVFTLFSSISFLTPSQFFNKGEGFYATNEGTTTVKDEYLPKWVVYKPTKHFKEKIEIIEGKIEIINLISSSKEISFEANTFEEGKVRINTIYYPGWKAYINGSETEIDYSNKMGVMDLPIKSKNKIKLVFEESPLRLFSNILSLISLAFLILLVCKRYGLK